MRRRERVRCGLEGERDEMMRQKDHECGALIDERDQLLVDTDARMLALTAPDPATRVTRHASRGASTRRFASAASYPWASLWTRTRSRPSRRQAPCTHFGSPDRGR